MSALIALLNATINTVGEPFVTARTQLMRRSAATDPRNMRPSVDTASTAGTFGINTWRRFGADAEWCLVGGAGKPPIKPSAIRPVRGGLGSGFALVLPGQASSTVHELLVYLPESAMAVLRLDEAYMQWVDQVVD